MRTASLESLALTYDFYQRCFPSGDLVPIGFECTTPDPACEMYNKRHSFAYSQTIPQSISWMFLLYTKYIDKYSPSKTEHFLHIWFVRNPSRQTALRCYGVPPSGPTIELLAHFYPRVRVDSNAKTS